MYLSGDGWEVKRKAYKEKQAAKKQNLEEESSSTPSPFPTLNLCAFIGIGSSDQEMIRLSLEDKVIYLNIVNLSFFPWKVIENSALGHNQCTVPVCNFPMNECQLKSYEFTSHTISVVRFSWAFISTALMWPM